METDLLPNVRGNVQTLRDMWSTRAQEEQKLLKLTSPPCRTHPQLQQKQSIKQTIQTPKSVDETIIDKEPTVTFDSYKSLSFEPMKQHPPDNDDDTDDFLPLPPPPASIMFKSQAQSLVALKQSVTKMFDLDKKITCYPNVKNTGIHHWHIARHVFRSGLIFGPSRRASDSIIPLLMKTHIAQSRSRRDSVDSNLIQTPFENLIDYLTYNNDDENMKEISFNIPKKKQIMKRTASDTSACIERNKLNDTIAQYETIMRHLKNYDKFVATHPVPSPVSSTRKTIDTEQTINKKGDISQQSSMRNRQTQSLARNAGRTFTEFIMNDLLLSSSPKPTPNEPRHLIIVHTASQTDIPDIVYKADSVSMEETIDKVDSSLMEETIYKADSVSMEETPDVVVEPEIDKEVPLTANSEVNVIVVNSPIMQAAKEETEPKEKSLMQLLFEGKKTAYTPNDLNMESVRIPEELMNTFEIAKKKCFFPTEQLLYSSKMVKIDRRGYKQHVRLLCVTQERVYIITKKDPYPKEAVAFKDILGIGCTPCRDGFICLHTRETREDRGDWLFIVDHPCEFVTQLFMAMGRTHNNDNYLKIKPKFKHTRRNIATITDECAIEVRPADALRIECEDYEILVIYTP